MKKLGFIDATRGWAILGVLLIHASTIGNNDNHPDWLSMLVRNGSSGVQLFFIASAFTLFLSFSRREDSEIHPKRNYFLRRVLRIAPLYSFAIVLYLWLEGFGPRYWLGDAPGISTANIIGNFLLIHQLSPYWINSIVPGGWSIAVEMSFYLLVPLLYHRLRNLSHAIYFFIFSLIFCRTLNPILAGHNPTSSPDLWGNFLYFYLPTQLPVFAIGIVTFFLLNHSDAEKHGDVRCSALSILSLGLMLGWSGLEGYLLPFSYSIGILAMAKWQIGILNNGIMRMIGRLSYGIYISHWACLIVMKNLGWADFYSPTSRFLAAANYGCRVLLLLIISGIFAYILQHAIEKPFQRIGKRLILRWENKANLCTVRQ